MSHQVAFDFAGVNPEELSVRAGEILTVVSSQDGWAKCQSVSTGSEGFVPESYLKPYVPPPVAAAPPRRSAPKAPGNNNSVPPAAAAAPTYQGNYGVPPPATAANAGSYYPPPAAMSSGLPPRAPTSDPRRPSSNLTKRGGGAYEIDKSSISYDQNLGEWRERERKFKKGEAERLPVVKQREYYYWDKQGVRQGPLSEAEMKAKFDIRQVAADTMIAPITTATGSEALPKMSVNDYFPDYNQTFTTAPIAPIENHTWLYLDDAGQVQGPFDAAQMREWFLDNYFNAETKAKLASRKDVGFVPLGVLFGQEGADAFLTDGDQVAASQHPQTRPGVARAVPPPIMGFSSSSSQDPFSSSYGVPPAYGGAPVPPAYSSYQDPYALPPPAISSGNSNPFASPARSPSNRGLGLTPKAQSGRLLLSMAISGQTTTNPFEAPDYTSPVKNGLSQQEDDWGITWDDEKEETTTANKDNSDMAVPVPITGSKETDTRLLAPFAKIQRNYLTSHDSLYHFLTRAIPKDLGTVRCKIRRSMVGMMHVNYNRYELFLEQDDGQLGPQIMEAVKHKRMGFDSYFQLQIGSTLPSHQGTVIAEVTMTTMGTHFLLHNNVKTHQGLSRDLACIHYLKTGSGGGPRKMTVAIPGFAKNSETEFTEWTHAGSIKKSKLIDAVEHLNFKDIQPLMNKPPVWSDKRGAWTLNFHGRVTKASVKNFQLVRPEDHDHIVLQHGRVGHDLFTMDVAWPMSMIQALSVCLSSLHAKLGVE